MIPSLRADFNRSWSQERYERLVAALSSRTGGPLPFPLSETPCFFPRMLMNEMAETGIRLIAQLENPAAVAAAKTAVPDRFRGRDDGPHPTFLQVDFGLVRDEHGRLRPKLVELQAFPSIYGAQEAFGDAYREAFALPASLKQYLKDHDRASYHALVGRAILGGHDPAEVVLMEIEPRRQKTWPDFAVTEAQWGVRAIDTSEVEREGARLFYRRDGVRTRIRRIYNRVIPDELERRRIALPFDYRDDLEVEWTGHPAWYFRISKFSIPFLDDPSVPKTWFLNELDRLPDDRERFLLKPLFSFAGGGIVFAPTDADVAAIPEAERRNYILQERIAFTPVIDTPYGATQVEVRIMYVWTSPGAPSAVLPLLRMGRGKMMGVDHNKGLRWVGASAAFIAE
jgi:hypothetical protein